MGRPARQVSSAAVRAARAHRHHGLAMVGNVAETSQIALLPLELVEFIVADKLCLVTHRLDGGNCRHCFNVRLGIYNSEGITNGVRDLDIQVERLLAGGMHWLIKVA